MPELEQNDQTPTRPSGRHRGRTAALVTAGVVALGTGLGVTGVAVADETPSPSPSSTPSSQPSEDAPPGRGAGGPGGGGSSELAAALAEELGVEESAVTEALGAAREEQGRPDRDGEGTSQEEREAARAEREAALVTSLAGSLDLPEADVRAALDAVRDAQQEERATALQERLSQAVQDGTLTQEEADAVTKAVEAGVVGGGHGPR